MAELFTTEALVAFLQVVMIDLVLAGDNAIVIGLAAAGLPKEQRTKAIVIGIAAATVLRIAFAGVTTQLLQIVGLLFAGGILLLWVSWKMWRELHLSRLEERRAAEAAASGGEDSGENGDENGAAEAPAGHGGMPRKTLRQAAGQIVLADISMSLDNVLAVAGAAKDHPEVLIFGLALSIVLMGVAAGFIAKLLNRHRWIAYVGLAIILYVALDMIYRGALDLEPTFTSVMGVIGL